MLLTKFQLEQAVSREGFKLAADPTSFDYTTGTDAPVTRRPDMTTPDTETLRRKFRNPAGAFHPAPSPAPDAPTDGSAGCVVERQVAHVVPEGASSDNAVRGKAVVVDPSTGEIISSQG